MSGEKENQYASIAIFPVTKEKFRLTKLSYQSKNKIPNMSDDDFLQVLVKSFNAKQGE